MKNGYEIKSINAMQKVIPFGTLDVKANSIKCTFNEESYLIKKDKDKLFFIKDATIQEIPLIYEKSIDCVSNFIHLLYKSYRDERAKEILEDIIEILPQCKYINDYTNLFPFDCQLNLICLHDIINIIPFECIHKDKSVAFKINEDTVFSIKHNNNRFILWCSVKDSIHTNMIPKSYKNAVHFYRYLFGFLYSSTKIDTCKKYMEKANNSKFIAEFYKDM